MKKFGINTLALLILFCTQLNAQGKSICYVHDKNGNVTQRKLQVLAEGKPKITLDSSHIKAISNFKIFPNPASQNINLVGELPKDYKQANIILMDMNGRCLKNDVFDGKNKSLYVGDIESGMYMLEIVYSKRDKETHKVLINN